MILRDFKKHPGHQVNLRPKKGTAKCTIGTNKTIKNLKFSADSIDFNNSCLIISE